jgi:enoyl-CoA hydratase
VSYENILVAVEDGVATITLNRPRALNALNAATLTELDQALDSLTRGEPRTQVRALILTGAGEKSFVAGADITEMAQLSVDEARRMVARGQEVLNRLERLDCPTVAAVNGFALGGGCELCMACDLIVASSKARFGQPEINLGVIPGFGGTQRLVRRVGLGRARRLVLFGDMVSAEEALAMGLCDQVFPPEELLPRARELALRLARGPRVALAAAKAALNAAPSLALHEGLLLEGQSFALCFGSDDQKEGMKAFLEKRPAQFTGK